MRTDLPNRAECSAFVIALALALEANTGHSAFLRSTRAPWPRGRERAARTALLTLAAMLAIGGCSSGGESPASLHAYIVEMTDAQGVSWTTDEIECLDEYVSGGLGIAYPASWSAYLDAFNARASTRTSQFEATGDFRPDTLWSDSARTCLTEQHLIEQSAVELTNTKVSTLTPQQRECLLAGIKTVNGSIPLQGIDRVALRRSCGIAENRTPIVTIHGVAP